MNIMVSTLREFFGPRRNRRITVILDTGVLLADDLDKFFGSLTDNVSVRIPLNCWMEIDFLRKYSNFDGIRRKAENIRSLYSTGRWKRRRRLTTFSPIPKVCSAISIQMLFCLFFASRLLPRKFQGG